MLEWPKSTPWAPPEATAWKERSLRSLRLEMPNGAATWEDGLMVSSFLTKQNTVNRTDGLAIVLLGIYPEESKRYVHALTLHT